jgi:hypothetical protein
MKEKKKETKKTYQKLEIRHMYKRERDAQLTGKSSVSISTGGPDSDPDSVLGPVLLWARTGAPQTAPASFRVQ